MAEAEESTMEDQEDPRRFGAEKGELEFHRLGLKSQTTVICKTCRQQVVISDLNTSNLFYHLKTQHEKQFRDSEKMRQSTNVTSKPQSDRKKKNTPNKSESLE